MTNDAERATARERAINRIVGRLVRPLAHSMRDALILAWNDGYEHGKKGG